MAKDAQELQSTGPGRHNSEGGREGGREGESGVCDERASPVLFLRLATVFTPDLGVGSPGQQPVRVSEGEVDCTHTPEEG